MNIGNKQQNFKYKIADWEEVIKQIDDMMYGSTDLRVKVCYDENAADIYTLDGRYILSADKAELSHSTEFESTQESIEALNEHMASKAMMRARAMEFTEDVQEVLAAADAEDELPEKELTYLQRAALNGGRAKDDNLRIQEDMEQEIDISNYLTNQL